MKNFILKPKEILLIIFSFWLAEIISAQNIQETYDFANQQFAAGNYEQALAEYQRVAFFDADNIFKDIFLKIGDSFAALEDFDRAAKNFDIAFRYSNNDSVKAEMVFRKANCLFIQNNFIFALNELFVLEETDNIYLKNKYNLYLGIGLFGMEDYVSSLFYLSKIVQPSSGEELTKIFNDFEKFRKRFNPARIQTMSILLPGLGQIYTGYIGSGINSMLLIGGIAVITVHLWQIYGFLEAALSTGSWYYRYYSGGYKNAAILAEEKIEHKREEVYHIVLNLVAGQLETNK